MKDETGKVVFDAEEQAVVDKIIQERLSRVKVPEDYEDLKEIYNILDDFDYQGTPQEKKAALKQQAETYKQQKQATQDEIDKLESKEERLTPAEKARLEKLEKVAEKIEADERAAEQKKQADEAWNKQVKEFTETYGDVDLDELALNPKFIKFVKGKSLPLKELYADFVEFIGDTEAEAIVKMKSKEVRSTGSGKAAGSEGGNYGLTPSQQALCKRSNMSYKEYAEILKNVQ